MSDPHDNEPDGAQPATASRDDAGAEQAVEEVVPGEKPRQFTDSYGLVLVMLVTSFFWSAVAGDTHYGRVVTLVFLAATTWLALRASEVERRLLRLAVALIPLLTVVAVVLSLLGSDSTARVVSATLAALLVIVAPVAIVKRLVAHPIVNANTFFGAVCVYLLLAMFFASAFAFTGAASGHPFFAQISPPDRAGTIDYLYFSFVTITTTGYGDLTAQGNVGRLLAVSEAVLGQLYLITVVALVVQNLGRERQRRKQPH
jgi:hypothetical protein